MHFFHKILILFFLAICGTIFYQTIGLVAFVPIWVLCGLIDFVRHTTKTPQLFKEYFTGKGKLTFILSPLNLAIDLISHKNLHTYDLDQLPTEIRQEIDHVINVFDEEKDKIEKCFAQSDNDRTMLFYKWYGRNIDESIAEFLPEFKHVKTIGVSLFKEKTSTSRHFGPFRATLRVLYNFNNVQKDGSYIEIDGTINIWKKNALCIFDDTLVHQSFNEEEDLRYCAFIDVLRPNYANRALQILLFSVGLFLKNTRAIFYKNWKMIQG